MDTQYEHVINSVSVPTDIKLACHFRSSCVVYIYTFYLLMPLVYNDGQNHKYMTLIYFIYFLVVTSQPDDMRSTNQIQQRLSRYLQSIDLWDSADEKQHQRPTSNNPHLPKTGHYFHTTVDLHNTLKGSHKCMVVTFLCDTNAVSDLVIVSIPNLDRRLCLRTWSD